jgi:excisionase family DNA binding protein
VDAPVNNYFNKVVARVIRRRTFLAMTTTKHPDLESMGEHLRRIRESRELSLRQAAKRAGISSAYLSQVEAGKRGQRKKNDEYFGPHPQILKKLAELYHISPSDLFARAGYLGDDAQTEGVGEQREIDRIFDFVLLDPFFRKEFPVSDKRAIIERYEVLTNKRLITWVGEPDTHQSMNKSELSGLRCEKGRLLADTPPKSLSISEVAQELECTESDVQKMIHNNQLHATMSAYQEWRVERGEMHRFKQGAVHNWIHNTATKTPVANPHATAEERFRNLESSRDIESPDGIYYSPAPAPAKMTPRKNTKTRK